MNFFQTFMQWLSKKITDRKQRKAQTNQQRLERLSCESLNVIEFNGKLYVSHQGAPIIPVSALNMDVEKMLVGARKDYLAWINKFDNGRYGKI
jgi:hypothetical protein